MNPRTYISTSEQLSLGYHRILLKALCVGLLSLAYTASLAGQSAGPESNSAALHFKFERFDTENGTLYSSPGGKDSYDNFVTGLLVDSSNRLWAGSVNGLSVYDGKQWTNSTFPPAQRSFLVSLLMGHNKTWGPQYLTEGPPGTVWFAGRSALTRYRDGQYEQIDPGTTSRGIGILGIAADHNGGLWVVTHENVQKYDGKTWTTVLNPIWGKVNNEVYTLAGVKIGTNGHIWIGGSEHGKMTEPFEHEGAVWVVDRENKKRNGGPPMAPLYEFDGRKWKAYGKPQGLNVDWAKPELDGNGQVVARSVERSSEKFFVQSGTTWNLTGDAEALAGKRWILRTIRRTELLFRDGQQMVEVRPTDARTGEVLDISLEQSGLVCIVEDPARGCVWLGTTHGLYKIWPEKNER